MLNIYLCYNSDKNDLLLSYKQIRNIIEKKGYRVSIHDTKSPYAQQKTRKAMEQHFNSCFST